MEISPLLYGYVHMGDIALDTMIEMRAPRPDLFEVSFLRREWEAMAFKYSPDGKDGTRRVVCLLPDLAKKTDLGRRRSILGPLVGRYGDIPRNGLWPTLPDIDRRRSPGN